MLISSFKFVYSGSKGSTSVDFTCRSWGKRKGHAILEVLANLAELVNKEVWPPVYTHGNLTVHGKLLSLTGKLPNHSLTCSIRSFKILIGYCFTNVPYKSGIIQDIIKIKQVFYMLLTYWGQFHKTIL